MSKRIGALVTTLVILSTVRAAGAAPSAAVHAGSLGLDQSLFWSGGTVADDTITHNVPFAALPVQDRCAQLDPCFVYTLDVAETTTTARLRVGFDTASRDDGFEMSLISPTGTKTSKQNSNAYSMELLVASPAVGRWTITVAPYSADYASFRMRAMLESAPWRPAQQSGDLLPNLRVTRIWEFGFAAPANPGNGLFPPDDVNPPLSAAGFEPMSCAVDEQLGYDGAPASRCLRFSFGLANAGEGNFDIRYTNDRTGTEQPMTQCIQNADASIAPRANPAGLGAFHQTHGHFHYKDVIYTDVWQVTDRTTWARTRIGDGRKVGYSPADQGIAEWSSFHQNNTGTSGSAGNCKPGTDSRLGMSVGWGDAYRFQRPGNFVEFSGAGDGYYVVHVIADPLGHVIESNDTDNTAYAYLQITGKEIHEIESGIGEGPWDPSKVLFER